MFLKKIALKNSTDNHINKNSSLKNLLFAPAVRLFIFGLLLCGLSAQAALSQNRTEISAPSGSVAFGEKITLLPNGNFVVVDSEYSGATPQTANIGAVYLYSAAGTLINKITGSIGNDFIGSGGITVLSNGDFVISSPRWNKTVSTNTFITGAVTKCSGTTGCSGQVTTANSLTGNIDGDSISQTINGTNQSGVNALPNGNYVVRSPYWGIAGFPNNTPSVGAVTFCNGSNNGCAGQTVTASNSLVGSVAGDSVGNAPTVVLSSGDYVVSSPSWQKSGFAAGAATLCSGTTGCAGAVSVANSLTGSVYSSLGGGDQIGNSGIFALPNNLYVVSSGNWNKPAPTANVGAVTLCNATSGNCTGQLVTAANSLTGSTGNDSVGLQATVLPSGDYVVTSPNWHNPSASGASGAVTLCRAAAGGSCTGQTVSTANSLTTNAGGVGYGSISEGVTVLTNGNYVVDSPTWIPAGSGMQSVGAVTFCNAVTNNCGGQVISSGNSLVGSSFGDAVGDAYGVAKGITPLTNGNYVVSSANWSDPTMAAPQGQVVGAATLCSGTSGCAGAVSRANSLTGSQSVDLVASGGVTALTNGAYVVNSPNWTPTSTQSGRGAVTLCGANNNCAGQSVATTNSLTGTKSDDRIGLNGSVALSNGNYVVVSPEWDASPSVTNVGAATFCNTATNSCANQTVSSANSLIGTTTDDMVGAARSSQNGTFSTAVYALANGNYVVRSSDWNNGATENSGAFTFGNGSAGTSGAITSSNSILGTSANGGYGINFITDGSGNKIFIGLPEDNKVVLVGAGARRTPFDFDGDGKTDVGIFRPSDGSWWYLQSAANDFRVYRFGVSSDNLAPGDYTGDGKTDIAIFRPADGTWYIQRSEDNSFFSFPFGANGDIPAPADYDADGKTDAAVYRPSTGTWFILNSGGSGTSIVNFGTAEDKPVPADYDGDGKADIAIFRPSDGSWWYLQSSNAQFKVYRFGVGTDKPVQGDYTGDGKADIAIFRPSTGEWFFQRSEDNSYYSFTWGSAGDIPAAGDYDGDGKFDAAVFRSSNSTWYMNQTTAGVGIVNFGSAGDRPVPNAFVP